MKYTLKWQNQKAECLHAPKNKNNYKCDVFGCNISAGRGFVFHSSVPESLASGGYNSEYLVGEKGAFSTALEKL